MASLPFEPSKHPSTPVGKRGNELNALEKNVRTIINGREYSGHALDRMQQRGLTPLAVENTIKNGIKLSDKNPARMVHYDSVNNITVITENNIVVSTFFGKGQSVD